MQNVLKKCFHVTQPSPESPVLCRGSGGDEFVTGGSLQCISPLKASNRSELIITNSLSPFIPC